MRYFNLRKITMTVAFALVAIFATSEFASAQNVYKEQRKQQKRIEKSQRKYAQQQQQQQQRYYAQRYRVYNNGRYYNTDDRGAQMLRQAVNNGYQQGFNSGKNDARRGYQYGYNSQSMYRSGNYGWSYVDQNQYRYYFQQGFQKGYQDGYYSRSQYGNNGRSMLSSILSTILNIQQY